MTEKNPRGAGRKPTDAGARPHSVHLRMNDAEYAAYQKLGAASTREVIVKAAKNC